MDRFESNPRFRIDTELVPEELAALTMMILRRRAARITRKPAASTLAGWCSGELTRPVTWHALAGSQ